MSWGLAIQGLGALAGAWGQYETGKKQAKIEQEKFDYAKQRDALADGKADEAQANLDNAFEDSILNTNKKKKKKTDDLTPALEPIAV